MTSFNADNIKCLQDVVDRELLKINKGKRIESFKSFMDRVLAPFSIAIETSDKEYLSVFSSGDGYREVMSIYSYLIELLDKRYISFIKTPMIRKSIKYGTSSETNRAYLSSAEATIFFTDHFTSNVCVSKDFKRFVKSGRVSLNDELAKKSIYIGMIVLVLSVASLIVGILALCCS